MKRGLKVPRMEPSLSPSLQVEETSPMKRGLKVERRICVPRRRRVEENSPMKRGLKGFNIGDVNNDKYRVEETSPMKRGLKGWTLALPSWCW